MGIVRRINSKAATDETTGFGSKGSMYGGRFMNQQGRPNVRKINIGFFESISWFHTLIEMKTLKFLMCLCAAFLSINLVFACVYILIGVEHLGGLIANTRFEKFFEAYFFSAQTFTTVGYGRINPTGYLMSLVAALEAFTGLLFFALATGLFYARFSRPQAYVRFSPNALISPYKDGVAFMCRMATYKNNYLTDAECKVTLALITEENGDLKNRFYPMELEVSKVNALSLSWTLVHPIDDKSPLFNLTEEDLKNYKAEVLIFVKAFDDTFSNTVVGRSSYSVSEFVFGAKFRPMYSPSQHGHSTTIDMGMLNSFDRVDISALMAGRQMSSSEN